jgi:outer membrane protein assembly factor BamB
MIRKVYMTALTLLASMTIAACGAPQQEAPQQEAPQQTEVPRQETPQQTEVPRRKTPRQTESASAPLRETTQEPPPAPVETPSGKKAGAAPSKTAGNWIWKYQVASNHPERWGTGIPKGVKFLTAEEQTLVIGSENFLDAVDTATGENLWVHKAARLTALDSGDGRLYLATRGEGGYTVEVATEQQVWKQDTEGVHAIKADTGESLWSAKITWPVKHLMAVDGKVYATTGRPQLHGIDAGTGENLWTFKTEGKIKYLETRGQTVYLGTEDRLYAVGAETGKKLWESQTRGIGEYLGETKSRPDTQARGITGAHLTGRLVIVDTESAGWNGVKALDAETGNELWSYETGIRDATAQSADGAVYLRTKPTGLLKQLASVDAVDLGSGALIWSYKAGEEERDRLRLISLAGGTLVLAVWKKGKLGLEITTETVDVATGKRIWASGKRTTPYAQADDGTVFVTRKPERQGTGNTEARDAATGRVVWTSGKEITGIKGTLVTEDLVILWTENAYLQAFTR